MHLKKFKKLSGTNKPNFLDPKLLAESLTRKHFSRLCTNARRYYEKHHNSYSKIVWLYSINVQQTQIYNHFRHTWKSNISLSFSKCNYFKHSKTNIVLDQFFRQWIFHLQKPTVGKNPNQHDERHIYGARTPLHYVLN